MKLYVARHGQTVWNVRNVVCGRTDIPLTEQGLAQAKALAEQAAQTEIDTIWCSPLIRARQTAQAVADRLGLPVTVDERLIEQNFGDFEEIDRFDREYLAFRENLLVHFPGGGESIAQVMARAYGVIEDIRKNHARRTILLVSHGAYCRALHTYFCDTWNGRYFDFRLENCQLQEYELP